MKISNKQYAQGLFEATHGKSGDELVSNLKNFVKLLAINFDISKIDAILMEFDKIWQREVGIVSAEVVSAKRLDHESLDLLKTYVVEQVGAKEVDLKHHVDHKLLSGFVLKFADQVVDGSGVNMINNLKKELTR